MADEGKIDLTVVATDQSGPALTSAANNVSKVTKSAAQANTELKKLGSTTAAPTIDVQLRDQAIVKAKEDIAALRASVAEGILLGTDTREATRDIAALQRSIKSLEDKPINIPVNVGGGSGNMARTNADLGRLRTQMFAVTSQVPGMAALVGTGGVLAASGLAAAGVVKIAGAFETLQTTMAGLLHDKGAAEELITSLRNMAATTPLKLDDIAQAAKTLISFGVPAGEVVTDVKNLGEAAAASGQSVASLALIWRQMVSFGSVDVQDMRQFLNAGVDFWGALATAMGVTKDQAQELVKAGKVGVADIEKLAAGFGKVYSGQTAAAAETFNGILNHLNSQIDATAESIGVKLMPEIESMIRGLGWIADHTPSGLAAVTINVLAAAGAAKTMGLAVGAIERAWQNAERAAYGAATAEELATIKAAAAAEAAAAGAAGAGAAGLAAGAEQAAAGTSRFFTGLKTVTNFLGGPWGIAVGVGTGLLELWASTAGKATKSNDDWVKSLDLGTASLSRNNAALAYKSLSDKNLIGQLKDAGVDINKAILGLTGTTLQVQRDAAASVNRMLLQAAQAARARGDEGERNRIMVLFAQYENLVAVVAANDFAQGELQKAVDGANAALGKQGTLTGGVATATDAATTATTGMVGALDNLRNGTDKTAAAFEIWDNALTLHIPYQATAAEAASIFTQALDDQASALSNASSKIDSYVKMLGILNSDTEDAMQANLDFQNALAAGIAEITPEKPAPVTKTKQVQDIVTLLTHTVTTTTQPPTPPLKTGLDLATEQGRKNIANLKSLVDSTNAVIAADIKEGKTKQQTLADYESKRQAIIKQTIAVGGLRNEQAALAKLNELGLSLKTKTEVGIEWDRIGLSRVQSDYENLKKPIVISIGLEDSVTGQWIDVQSKKDGLATPIIIQYSFQSAAGQVTSKRHLMDQLGMEGSDSLKIPVTLVPPTPAELKKIADAMAANGALIGSMYAQIYGNNGHGQGWVPTAVGPTFGPVVPRRAPSMVEATNLLTAPTSTVTNTVPTGGASSSTPAGLKPPSTVVNVHVNDRRYQDLLEIQVSEMVGTAIRRMGATRRVTTG